MIFREKIEYAITGNVEYIINLLAKHNVAINRPIVKNDRCFVKISSNDREKVEKILKNYGKKFELIKVYGKGINIKKLAKKHLFWVGVIISILAIFFYSQTIINVQIIGLKRIDESTVYQAVLSEIKPPIYVTKNVMNKIEKTVINIDGISYVSAKKEGRTLKVNIVEELSKIDKLDTQNLISVKASEEGMITKIVVYGGTCLVKVGDKVSKGQELIAPYHLNADGDRKPTLAFGKIEAKITKEIQLTYSNEREYNERFLQEYDEQTRLVKEGLSKDEKYLGTHFFVKNVDKSIVCSIYYDIITRIA